MIRNGRWKLLGDEDCNFGESNATQKCLWDTDASFVTIGVEEITKTTYLRRHGSTGGQRIEYRACRGRLHTFLRRRLQYGRSRHALICTYSMNKEQQCLG